MIKWTTPSLKCTIPEGLEYDYILLTLIQGNYTLEKRIPAIQVIDNEFSVFFTQEETSSFKLFEKIDAQLNVMKGSIRQATNIVSLQITRNLHDEFIEPDIPTELSITMNGVYNVANYLSVDVNVETGITPTGEIEISNNGTYDITNYASANVNVSAELEETLLWENSNLDSGMEGNTVLYTGDYSNYKYIKIVYKTIVPDNFYTLTLDTLTTNHHVIVDEDYIEKTCVIGGGNYSEECWRVICFDDNEIVAMSGRYQRGYDDNCAVPIAIYGVGTV